MATIRCHSASLASTGDSSPDRKSLDISSAVKNDVSPLCVMAGLPAVPLLDGHAFQRREWDERQATVCGAATEGMSGTGHVAIKPASRLAPMSLRPAGSC